jgi:hypothetical protein
MILREEACSDAAIWLLTRKSVFEFKAEDNDNTCYIRCKPLYLSFFFHFFLAVPGKTRLQLITCST